MVAAAPLGGSYDPASFRDPLSRVFHADGDVYRTLSPEGLEGWHALRESACFTDWMADGRLVATEELVDDGSTYLKHQRIPFWSHPYEWSFSMLRDAALLHLDLLEEALGAGLTMKDATPYNIQFVDLSPVFVDVGSFSRYETGEPWLGYRQFCQQFLYPLLLRAHADVPFQPLLRGSLDGIPPATARAFLRSGRTFKPGVLLDVALQARADRSTADRSDDRNVRSELSAAGFNAEMIVRNVRRLRKVMEKTRWSPASSPWSDYASCGHVADQRGIKEAFVRQVAGQRHRRLVWDLGANDGHFSAAVADVAEVVIAMDADEVTVDNTYRRLKTNGPRNVLPLVMNLADPSPGLGWRGAERLPLEGRGTPDLVLMLAVIHHLVIGSNLPLASVIDWLATLGSEVVLEWVPLDDPMSQRLTANKRRHEVHADYTEEDLRRYCGQHFSITTEQPCETRRLFHLTPLR
ncbi:MAG: methyltransferase [Acidimicrobiia bacterium]|nr:methyltransferase [Acidimicrobiia bacterium]